MNKYASLILCASFFLQMTSGGVILKIELKRLQMDVDCDFLSACDPFVMVCVNQAVTLEETMTSTSCDVMEFQTFAAHNQNDVVFGPEKGNTFFNSVSTSLPVWEGFVGIRVDFMDSDWIASSKLLTNNISMKVSPSRNLSGEVLLIGDETANLTLNLLIQCEQNYFGQDCSVHCDSSQPPQRFTCDEFGQPRCLRGYYGVHCNSTYSTPLAGRKPFPQPTAESMNGTENTSGTPLYPHLCAPTSHYSCSRDGEKLCVPGRYGYDCEIECTAEPAVYGCSNNGQKLCYPGRYGPDCDRFCQDAGPNGTYICDSTGRKVCQVGWYGSNCDVQCERTNNTVCSPDGDILCLAPYNNPRCSGQCVSDPKDGYRRTWLCVHEGRRICRQGYYGLNCDRGCSPTTTQVCQANGTSGCRAGYFGHDCSSVCEPSLEKNFGCDELGNKLCFSNRYGENCHVVCKPRNDSVSHYGCDLLGRRICHQNYVGTDCDISSVATDDGEGHDSYSEEGARVCTTGYYGDNCTIMCVPREDSGGHYNCSEHGERVCHKHYHGEQCTVYCNELEGNTGRFTCDQRGKRVCIHDYYGVDCTVFCRVPNNLSFCDHKGRLVCIHNQYGPNCTTHCLARNDTHGAYLCNSAGERVCIGNWFGSNCSLICKGDHLVLIKGECRDTYKAGLNSLAWMSGIVVTVFLVNLLCYLSTRKKAVLQRCWWYKPKSTILTDDVMNWQDEETVSVETDLERPL